MLRSNARLSRTFFEYYITGCIYAQAEKMSTERLQTPDYIRVVASGKKHMGISGPDCNMGYYIGQIRCNDSDHLFWNLLLSCDLVRNNDCRSSKALALNRP